MNIPSFTVYDILFLVVLFSFDSLYQRVMSLTHSYSTPEPELTVQEPESYILHRHTAFKPPRVVGADGNCLYLEDGRKIFDAAGGAAVSCLGQDENIKAVVKEALWQQLSEVAYVHSGDFTTSSVEQFATELVDSTDGKMAKAFIISSGKPLPCTPF